MTPEECRAKFPAAQQGCANDAPTELNTGNWTKLQPQGQAPGMTHSTSDRVLFALFCFSRDSCRIDASELGRAVGLTACRTASALIELERAGLVDAGRARLTLLGLARAVALEAGGGGQPAVDLSHARPSARRVTLKPVAARGGELPARSLLAG